MSSKEFHYCYMQFHIRNLTSMHDMHPLVKYASSNIHIEDAKLKHILDVGMRRIVQLDKVFVYLSPVHTQRHRSIWQSI